MRHVRRVIAVCAVAAAGVACGGTEPLQSTTFALVRIADAPLPAPSLAPIGPLVVGGAVTLSSTTASSGTLSLTRVTRAGTSGVEDSVVLNATFTRSGSRILWRISPSDGAGVFEIQPGGRVLVQRSWPCPINALCVLPPLYTYIAPASE